MLGCVAILLAPTALACSDSPSELESLSVDAGPMPVQCIPRDQARPMPSTATEYAQLCSLLLGQMPTADCGEGIRIPITVNGVEVFESPADKLCDHTGFKGECSPGSTLRRQTGKTMDGEERPQVVWVTFCRATGADPNRTLGSVQMIGHDIQTGATCFFESPDAVGSQAQREWVMMDQNGVLDGTLPAPGEPGFDRAWIPPPSPCSNCHHNDPFIHNPWIDGARLPEDPSQSVLPEIARANSPYWIVGGADWDLRTPHIEGNTCTTCHRVGMGTVDIFNLTGVLDINTLMPPSDPGSGIDDYNALRDCWENGSTNNPNCDWKNPPGVYCGEPAGTPNGTGDNGQESPCPDDFDLSTPCSGTPETTACSFQGQWYWCQDGVWTNEK